MAVVQSGVDSQEPEVGAVEIHDMSKFLKDLAKSIARRREWPSGVGAHSGGQDWLPPHSARGGGGGAAGGGTLEYEQIESMMMQFRRVQQNYAPAGFLTTGSVDELYAIFKRHVHPPPPNPARRWRSWLQQQTPAAPATIQGVPADQSPRAEASGGGGPSGTRPAPPAEGTEGDAEVEDNDFLLFGGGEAEASGGSSSSG